MNILQKIQNLSEAKKKIILWSIVIIFALLLSIWWLRNVRDNLQSFPREEFREKFQFPEMPKIEMPEIKLPEISEEGLKQLEEQLKKVENAE